MVLNPEIYIPVNEARHKEVAYYEFNRPAEIHDLVPHSHYRGVASKFEIVHNDGRKETILSVPNYDFNWQRTYEFVEPKRVEAGDCIPPGMTTPQTIQATLIQIECVMGTTELDEMLYGAFSYTYVNETTEDPLHDKC